MNQKYILWIIAGVIIIAGAGFLAFNQSQKNQTASDKTMVKVEDKMMNDDKSSTMSAEEDKAKDEKMMGDANKMTDENSTMMELDHYQDNSTEAIKSAQQSGQKVVLFFYAPWCPYCRAADKAFKENPGSIPAEVTVFKTDYDSNTDLKKKYGVTYQHTFVQCFVIPRHTILLCFH